MPAKNLTVLAIDDNQDNLTVLEALIDHTLPGTRTLTALDGRRGLELAASADPDVILLDIIMPGMDGYTVCSRIKEDAKLKETPVVFLTALRGDTESRVRALEVGADAFLSKPIDTSELTAQIRAMAQIKAANAYRRLEKEQLAALVAERTRELEHELAERRKVEAALLRESSIRDMLLENFPALALVIRRGTREVVFSNTNARAAGVVPGNTCFATWAKRDAPCAFCLAPDPWTDGKAGSLEVQCDAHHFDIRWMPLDDELFVHYIFDITERKRAEEDTKQLQAQFLHAQKMESVGRLAGGVAHDFNNLLTVINGYSDLLLEELKPGDPAGLALEQIHSAGLRAQGLVRQLLAFSRKQVLKLEELNLNATVAGMESLVARLVGEDVRVVLNTSAGLAHVLADRNQLEQVIMNLAVNARDAMPQGGTLFLETGERHLEGVCPWCKELITPGVYVELSVRDTGTGMDAQAMEHLFEPFFTTKRVGEGTGLGLSTVQGIVMQSGGHIGVESELGKGTSFHVFLPAAATRRLPQDAPHTTQTKGGKERILLVEDQAEVRHFIALVLARYGYEVVQAANPEEAMRELAARPAELLMTDVVMPQMSGVELAERARTVQPGLKTLFMSGYSEEVHQRQGRGLAGAAFLQKPFQPSAVAAKVREVLAAGPD